MKNQYYCKPFHIEHTNTYHDGWLKAEADLKDKSLTEVRDSFNVGSSNEYPSLSAYYYDKGYFEYICQYASDNKLI